MASKISFFKKKINNDFPISYAIFISFSNYCVLEDGWIKKCLSFYYKQKPTLKSRQKIKRRICTTQIHTYLLKFEFVIHSYICNHSKQEFGAGKIWPQSPNILLQKLNNLKKFEDLASTTHQS